MKIVRNGTSKLIDILHSNLMDFILILGIISISIGAFLTSIVTGFYVTGILLILFAVSLFFLGGD